MAITLYTCKWLPMGIILWMLSPFCIYAQILDPVSFQIEEDDIPATVKAGSVFEITVTASIDENWYLYSILNDPEAGPIPTTFASEGAGMKIAGDISESEAVIRYDPNFDARLGHHSGSAGFRIPIIFHSSLTGSHEIGLNVRYQACDDISCLPPKTVILRTNIVLEEGKNQDDFVLPDSDFGTGTDSRKYADSLKEQEKNGSAIGPIIFTVFFIMVLLITITHYGRMR